MALLGKKATLTLAVDRPDLTYALGSTIKAQVTLDVQKPFTIRRGWIVLCANETYVEKVEFTPRDSRGNLDYTRRQITEETRHELLYRDEHEFLPQPSEIPAGLLQAFDVTFRLPSTALPTYHGKILQIDWQLIAYLDVHRGSDIIEKGLVYVVKPLPSGMAPHRLINSGSSQPKVCNLSFQSTSSAFLPGDKVEGQLQVIPAQGFKARHVEAELRRVESVCDGNNERKFRIGRSKVPCTSPFSAGQIASFTLAFDLPAEQFLPSVRSHHGYGRWELAVSVKRWLHKNIHHMIEIEVWSNSQPAVDPQSLPCPRCGHNNRPSARFCKGCGQALSTPGAAHGGVAMRCPSCSQNIPDTATFCAYCGTDAAADSGMCQPL